MNGFVDDVGRALLNIDVRPDSARQAEVISAWVDTGFTGELVLPQKTVDALALVRSGSVDAILADGSQIELNTYTCFVNWFGEERRLEVVANVGDYPLLGVGLLFGLELRVNYQTLELTLVAGDRRQP